MVQRILAHAAKAPEREVCGLLLGPPLSAPAPFALSLSKGCPSSSAPPQEERTGLRQAQPERGGRSESGAGCEWVERVVETANVAPDPATTFEIDPAALFAALRAERAGGPLILGHYHSHPHGAPIPSARDAAMALQPGRLWLIVAAGAARMWREVPGGAVHGAFAPVELVVEGADDGCT